MPRVTADTGQEQIHGFNFQKLIRAQYGLDTDPNHNEKWDMEIGDKVYSMKMDSEAGLPLSSLLAFYEIDRPFIMIVGWHKNYRIHTVAEFDVSLDVLDRIRGNIPLEFVEQSCNMLTLKNWPEGTHEEAKAWAKEHLALVKKRYNPLLTWNRKVDTKKQRRWQCSLNATNLKKCFPDLKKGNPVYRGFDYSTINHMKLDQKHIDELQEMFLSEQKVAA
jgi:hypothetical protein